jgi:hypothetical protein
MAQTSSEENVTSVLTPMVADANKLGEIISNPIISQQILSLLRSIKEGKINIVFLSGLLGEITQSENAATLILYTLDNNEIELAPNLEKAGGSKAAANFLNAILSEFGQFFYGYKTRLLFPDDWVQISMQPSYNFRNKDAALSLYIRKRNGESVKLGGSVTSIFTLVSSILSRLGTTLDLSTKEVHSFKPKINKRDIEKMEKYVERIKKICSEKGSNSDSKTS